MNRSTSYLFAAVILALSAWSTPADTLTLNFSNLPNTWIAFQNSEFSFTEVRGEQFRVNSVTGGGSAVGLLGHVANGPFTIGAITVNGALQSAPVTGLGALDILDNAGKHLKGTVDWSNVETFSSIGGVNFEGELNVSTISYSGTDPDLLALAAAGNDSMILSFQFSPGMTLTELKSSQVPQITSYSGSISADSAVGPSGEPVSDAGSAGVFLTIAVGAGLVFFRNSAQSRL